MNNKQIIEVAQYLYGLLDDIDAVSNMTKNDDKSYRNMVTKIQAKKRKVVNMNDGYMVTFKPLDRQKKGGNTYEI